MSTRCILLSPALLPKTPCLLPRVLAHWLKPSARHAAEQHHGLAVERQSHQDPRRGKCHQEVILVEADWLKLFFRSQMMDPSSSFSRQRFLFCPNAMTRFCYAIVNSGCQLTYHELSSETSRRAVASCNPQGKHSGEDGRCLECRNLF